MRRLAHSSGQQRLPQHVVDLVRAGVVEVLTLEQDPHLAAGLLGHVLGEPGGLRQWGGASRVVTTQYIQLGVKVGVSEGGLKGLLKLVEGSLKCLRDEAATEGVKMAVDVGQVSSGHGRPFRWMSGVVRRWRDGSRAAPGLVHRGEPASPPPTPHRHHICGPRRRRPRRGFQTQPP